MTPLPRVGLPTDHKQIGAHPFLAVGEKYVRAVVDGAGCLPLLVPTLDPVLPLRQVLQRAMSVQAVDAAEALLQGDRQAAHSSGDVRKRKRG